MKFYGSDINDNSRKHSIELSEATIVTSSIEEIDTLIEFLQYVKQDHLRNIREYNITNTHTHLSLWANDYGMPNELTIITDVSNNENYRCEDASGYKAMVESKEFNALDDLNKLKEMNKYFERFVNNDFINIHFAKELFYRINMPEGTKKEFVLKACKRILQYSNVSEYRRDALFMLDTLVGDEELKEMTKYNVTDAEYNEMIEQRAFCRGENEAAKKSHYAINTETVYQFLNRPVFRLSNKEQRIAWEKERMKIIRSFGEGDIPSAWLKEYASCYIYMAHAEADEHNYIEAMDYLDEYLDFTEKHLITIKDGDILSYGNETIFGDLKRKAVYGKGNGCPHAMMAEPADDIVILRSCPIFIFYPDDLLYEFKENKTFFPMRDNARYKALVKRAEAISDKWIKDNG